MDSSDIKLTPKRKVYKYYDNYKKYYDNTKNNKIMCECGKEYGLFTRYHHLKSKFHHSFLEKKN